ncbi:adenosylcobalamin-dependent ribonucleoside-diphosphate reductase [Candidatus Woesearchaeota archaeon]|nr:adenosylcobalamin-dependent ribonucleoside-diphosphate reductase [Candidatus Woesearchaeota archaeon]
MGVTHIVKRSGKRVLFNEHKITEAIWKGMQATGEGTEEDAEKVKSLVVKMLEKSKETPSVEDVQDCVEQALIESSHTITAKSYILYRNERAKLREQKAALIGGQIDELKLSYNAVRLLERRYLSHEEGQISETPTQMLWRVAKHVAMAEVNYDKDPKNVARTYFRLISSLEFLPGSPVLMHSGKKSKQLSSCFVLPIEDDLKGIFHTLEQAAVVQQAGGGTGFSFSRLRPKGDIVDSTRGVAAGPLAYLKVYEAAMQAVKSGGTRIGANMAVLQVDHPDILDFINLKLSGGMENFNLSVGITDDFMYALDSEAEYDLINPQTKEPAGRLSAQVVFDSIISAAWRCGDPGIVFLDRMNNDNPCSHLGKIEATNPCAEQPLLPFESCPEGSINLTTCVKVTHQGGEVRREVDWPKLKRITRTSIQFLDDVISVNRYPIKETAKMAENTRKIGLGVMGFADMLFMLRIPYASEEAVVLADELSQTIYEEADKTSQELAKERGTFKSFKRSIHDKAGRLRRNSTVLGIAPTGSISIIAGCSSGIEPNFALAYSRSITDGGQLMILNEAFETAMDEEGIPQEVMQDIAKKGSVTDELPDDLAKIFVTAQQVAPEWHIKIQAAWQKHVDGAISKTINFPSSASVRDIERGMLLAWGLGCKGITAYRDGSLDVQVLNTGGGA